MYSDDGRVISQSWMGLVEQLGDVDFQSKRVGSHAEAVNDCPHRTSWELPVLSIQRKGVLWCTFHGSKSALLVELD